LIAIDPQRRTRPVSHQIGSTFEESLSSRNSEKKSKIQLRDTSANASEWEKRSPFGRFRREERGRAQSENVSKGEREDERERESERERGMGALVWGWSWDMDMDMNMNIEVIVY
jgi:hypothetical protein